MFKVVLYKPIGFELSKVCLLCRFGRALYDAQPARGFAHNPYFASRARYIEDVAEVHKLIYNTKTASNTYIFRSKHTHSFV
jgi:hypothetical protein